MLCCIIITVPDSYSVFNKATGIHKHKVIRTTESQFKSLAAIFENAGSEIVIFYHAFPAGKSSAFMKNRFKAGIAYMNFTPLAAPAVKSIIHCIHKYAIADDRITCRQIEGIIILVLEYPFIIREIGKYRMVNKYIAIISLTSGNGPLYQAIRYLQPKPITGEFLDEASLDCPLEFMRSQCSATVECEAPTFYKQDAIPDPVRTGYSRLLLPMWGDGHISMLLGVVAWE